MSDTHKPVFHHQLLPQAVETLGGVSAMLKEQGLDAKLIHLVDLRASQINQCAYCVKMHLREAREAGETEERLDRLIVWRHVNDFTAAEKAAFAWTEALTVLGEGTNYGVLRADLRQHYTDKDITVLTAAVAMINLWNRIQISNH